MKLIISADAITPKLTGIGRYTWELVKRLRNEDIEDIKFFNQGTWTNTPENLLKVSPGKNHLRETLSKSPFATWLYYRLSPIIFSKQLQDYSDYIYHSTNFFLPPHPGRMVSTFHDMSIYRHPEYHPKARVNLMKKALPDAAQKADHIITVSEYSKQEITAILDYPSDKISVIYNGVSDIYHPRPEAELTPYLDKYQIKNKRYFLSVATLEPRKNLAGILDAYEQLPLLTRQYYPLVLVGSGGWHSKSLALRIQRAETAGWVRYLGYTTEQQLPLLYAGATGLIFVPFYEGFGIPVLEAMASGTPVIASNTTSLPEVTGTDALTLAPKDIDNLKHYIETLIEDQDLAIDLSAKGIARSKLFNWDTIAQETIEVYRKVAAG